MDRIPFELIETPGQSSVRVEMIDTSRYANESVPRGYARTAAVPEDCCPTCGDTPEDPRFHNEKL